MTVERTASLVFFTLLVGGLLISADQKIISSEAGQNVTLTCQAPNNSILVVEWKRANLDEYGLLYRDGRLYPANQHTSFKNRVELQDIELKHGDVSLILKNVMITDSGTYKCFVVMEIGNNNKSPIITINLNITDPPASDQQIFRQAGMSVNLTFLVPTGTTSVWLKRLEKYKDNEKYISYCKDLTPTHPNDQEESFKGRVEGMNCSNISGTVSVTLKNLTRNDSGTYEFHGVDHGGRYFNKTVFLNVTDPGHTGGGKNNGDSRGHLGLLVGPFVVLLVCVLVCVKCVKWLKNRSKKNSPFSSLPNNEADRKVEQSANNSVV